MGFINRRQYLELNYRSELRVRPVFGIEDFKDQSDRTLTFSEDHSVKKGIKAFRHIFILHGQLFLHVYEVDENGVITTRTFRTNDFISANEVDPGTRRKPSVTDYEFATIMEGLHKPILFYVPEYEGDNVQKVSENFFGLTTPSWELVSNSGDLRDF
jgi:hypothetical protein